MTPAPFGIRNRFKLVALMIILTACDSEFLNEGGYYFLKNKGAVMPLWVTGNLESEVMIVTIHGGPGESGHEFPLSPGFKLLEKKYGLAYWDQRFSGLSKGDPNPNTLTIDHFVEDVQKMVNLIDHLYPGRKLFLLGHSWGGGLAAAYLGRANHQGKFSGWIDLNGSLYDSLETREVKKWILDRIPARIAAGEDPEFWEYIIKCYEAHPEVVYSDIEPYIYLSALGGDIYDYDNYSKINQIPYARLAFASPFSVAFYTKAMAGKKSFVDHMNFTTELQAITIPTLILWGQEDGIVPVAVAHYTYQTLGTDISQKDTVILKRTAHSPHYESPEPFYKAIDSFIQKNR